MAGNRKKAEKELFRCLDAMYPGNKNVDLYKNHLAKFSDAQFEQWINRLDERSERLTFIAPNFRNQLVDGDTLIALLRSLGFEPFKRVWMVDETTTPPTRYLTNDKYLMLQLPLRRQNQLLVKKMSTADHNNSRDDLTGQASGKASKTATLSFPEIQMLYGKGLDKVIEEQIKVRGGDEMAFRAYNYLIYNQGSVTCDQIEQLDSTVTSTETLNTFLKVMHYSANF